MHLDHNLRLLQAHLNITTAFANWLAEEPDRLTRAADLLGGAPWVPHATRVAEAVASDADLSNVLGDLQRLHRLLSLECVNDPFSNEARRFMSVHPDSPEADATRLCAEAVARVLPSVEALAQTGDLKEVA